MDIHIEDDSTESGLVCMTAKNWVEKIFEGVLPFFMHFHEKKLYGKFNIQKKQFFYSELPNKRADWHFVKKSKTSRLE